MEANALKQRAEKLRAQKEVLHAEIRRSEEQRMKLNEQLGPIYRELEAVTRDRVGTFGADESENQPSANGATTRPSPTPVNATI